LRLTLLWILRVCLGAWGVIGGGVMGCAALLVG